MKALSLDFETRSAVDIWKSGAYRYADDPTTEILCAAYSFADPEVVRLWLPGDPVPEDVADHVLSGLPIRAWNAAFERIVWRAIWGPRWGFPIPALDQFYCTAADAAALALPRGLGTAAQVLGLKAQKDTGDRGRKLMLKLTKPATEDPLTWHEDPDDLRDLYEYCRGDVRAEMAAAAVITPLPPMEREKYLLDQVINDRGVKVDLDLVAGASKIVVAGTKDANAELKEITGLRATQVQKLTEWVQNEGVDLDNLKSDTLRDFLAEEEGIPPHVRKVLEIRREVAKSSNAKLDAFERYAQDDDRCRGMLLYHGASTGRWSGKGPQPQNFPRGNEVKDIDRFLPAIRAGDYPALVDDEHHPLLIVSCALRRMLVAEPDHRFFSGDYSQIEARVLAWIAGQADLIERFRDGDLTGHSIVYEAMAAYIYGVPVVDIGPKSVERQVGKNSVLGCGFGMGAPTFKKQVRKQTGILLTDEVAERAVTGYRSMNDKIPVFWDDIYTAAFDAVDHPGLVTEVGVGAKIRFVKRGQFLYAVLPSGRALAYAMPDIRPTRRGVSLTYAGTDPYTKKWGRRSAYGGLLAENVVQAMARDILAEAMVRLEHEGYPNVLTVHDEAVTERFARDSIFENHDATLERMHELMSINPAWAPGLPIAVSGWHDTRYRKD